jgi:ABC-type phosphate transport system substrate-binding protein
MIGRNPRSTRVSRAARGSVTLFALMLLAAGPWFGSVAQAKSVSKAVTVAPNTNLGDSQFVQVSWSGFGAFVFFRQCTQAPANVLTDCTPLYGFPGYSDKNGAGVAYEQVHMGDVTNGSGGTFRCDVNTPCSMGVFSDTTLASGAFAEVQFAPTPDDCPDPDQTVAIAGSGADQANNAIYRWSTQVCQPPANLPVGYLSQNSIDGRQNFIAGLTDFAVTMTPFTSSEQKQLDQNRQTYAYAPVTTSALVLAFKMFDQSSGTQGAQILHLKLTPALIAQMFTGKIVNWNTVSDIKNLNPGFVFPRTIDPLVRGDHSAANLFLTGWLTATAKNSLPKDWPGPSVDYPLQYLVQADGVVGGDRLAHAMAEPTILGDQLNGDFSQVGYVGFIDASEAAYYGLPTVQIQNAGGQYVAATPDSILAGLQGSTKAANGKMLQPNYTNPDPNAYPIPLVSYVVAPTDIIDYKKGATLTNFLKYAVTDGQSDPNLPLGYVPLTSDLVAQTQAVADQIPNEPGEGSPPPPSSPPPTSPSPSPTDTFYSPSPYPSDSGYSPFPIDTGVGVGTGTGSGCAASTASPLPSESPSASPSPSSSGSASASSSPSASPSASPTPSPTGSAGATTASPSASPSASSSSEALCATAASANLPTSSVVDTAARFLLPCIAGLALLGVFGGLGTEVFSRRGGSSLSASAGRALQRLPLPRWLRP